jgi:hypothetical protein
MADTDPTIAGDDIPETVDGGRAENGHANAPLSDEFWGSVDECS